MTVMFIPSAVYTMSSLTLLYGFSSYVPDGDRPLSLLNLARHLKAGKGCASME